MPQLVAGKYELVRQVAEGGMGAIYEARNTSTFRRCALKLLSSPEFEQHPEIVQRFFLEARAASVLESEHIVQVFDSGIDNETGRPYIVMEYLQGYDLKNTLEIHGPLEPWVAAKIALQAARGLAKAHELGIFHRDIKPANLFLTRRDSGEICVKLLDFGIAKVKTDTGLLSSGTLTRTGGLLGTPLYMSPEQVRRPATVDARTDVWSLGIVLFECLSGDVPFPSEGTVGELVADVLTSQLRLLQDVSPWVPSNLAAIVHQALSRDLNRRYPDAKAMRDALAQALSGNANFHENALIGVSAADKTRISPRLVLLHDQEMRGTAAAETRQDPPRARHVGHEPTWVSSSNAPGKSGATTTAREKRRLTGAMFGALGILAAFGFGAALFARTKPTTTATTPGPSAAASATVRPARPELALAPLPGPAPSASANNERELWLRVPAQTQVQVNGVNTPVTAGRVAIHGLVGDAPTIELSRGKQRLSTRVAITGGGLLPDHLEFAAMNSAASQSARSTPNPGSAATVTASKPSPATSASGPSPKLVESTSEF
jgi:serine/threonine-protein kinase